MLVLAAALIAASLRLVYAQSFPLPDFGDKAGKDSQLPAGFGDIIGQVKDLTGNQNSEDEARSGAAIAATVMGAAPVA